MAVITGTPTRRRAATRDRLMDAAVALFAERGVLGASVEEISERAGFTRGAFYSNFGSKDDLVLALLGREADVQIEVARNAVNSVLTDPPAAEQAPERIESAVEAFFAAQRTDRDWVVAERELRLYAIRTPEIAAQFRTYETDVHRELEQLIIDALAAVGREFGVPMDQALAMLKAVYEFTVLEVLVDRSPGRAPRELMTTLLGAITRPRTLPR